MLGFRICFVLASLSLPAVALAQAQPAEPQGGKINLTPSSGEPPRGKIDLTTQPPAPPVQRSYRLHDGFYLRGSVGFGSLGATFDDDNESARDLEGSGFSLGLDLMIGGSPSPGLAIGGALLAQGAFSAEFERARNDTENRNLSVVLLGPFIDGFPVATKGWHVGGMLGLAAANIEDSSRDGVSETVGLGGAAWFGHDFWVADEWSVGPMLRLNGTLTRNEDDDTNASTFSVLFLFTALHH